MKTTKIICAVVILLSLSLLLSGCIVATGSPTKLPAASSAPSSAPSSTPSSVSESEATEATQSPEEDKRAKVGETLDYYGLQITFNSVEQYIDNSKYITDKPKDGKMFVLLWFTVNNTRTTDEHINMFYEDSYCDDFSIDPKMMLNVSGTSLWGDVAAGKKSKGYVAYEMDDNWETIEFQYTPEIFGAQSTKMIFFATRNDMKAA